MMASMSSRNLRLRTNEVVPIYYSDLTSNSSRYDRIIASPPDDERNLMWTLWTSVTAFSIVVTTIVFASLLSCRKARKNALNLYLMAIILPDTLFAITCFSTCLTNRREEAFTSRWMCEYQSFYITAAVCANAYMNAVVARELFIMLSSSQTFRRYQPPTAKQVIIRALCVYAFSCVLASGGLLHYLIPNFPFKAGLSVGVMCVPVEYDLASTIFIYLIYMPIVLLVPLTYVAWIFIKLVRGKMIPPTGKRRILFICFFQLVLVFVFLWLPAGVLMFITGKWTNPWWTWIGGSSTHLQGSLSALVLTLKPDVGEAVRRFVGCTRSVDDDDQPEEDPFSVRTYFASKVQSIRSGLSLEFRTTSALFDAKMTPFGDDVLQEDSQKERSET